MRMWREVMLNLLKTKMEQSLMNLIRILTTLKLKKRVEVMMKLRCKSLHEPNR